MRTKVIQGVLVAILLLFGVYLTFAQGQGGGGTNPIVVNTGTNATLNAAYLLKAGDTATGLIRFTNINVYGVTAISNNSAGAVFSIRNLRAGDGTIDAGYIELGGLGNTNIVCYIDNSGVPTLESKTNNGFKLRGNGGGAPFIGSFSRYDFYDGNVNIGETGSRTHLVKGIMTFQNDVSFVTNRGNYVISSTAPVLNTAQTNGAVRGEVIVSISLRTTAASDVAKAQIISYNAAGTTTNVWPAKSITGLITTNDSSLFAKIQPSHIWYVTNISTGAGSVAINSEGNNFIQQ